MGTVSFHKVKNGKKVAKEMKCGISQVISLLWVALYEINSPESNNKETILLKKISLQNVLVSFALKV
jgi:hypothetical protein